MLSLNTGIYSRSLLLCSSDTLEGIIKQILPEQWWFTTMKIWSYKKNHVCTDERPILSRLPLFLVYYLLLSRKFWTSVYSIKFLQNFVHLKSCVYLHIYARQSIYLAIFTYLSQRKVSVLLTCFGYWLLFVFYRDFGVCLSSRVYSVFFMRLIFVSRRMGLVDLENSVKGEGILLQ